MIKKVIQIFANILLVSTTLTVCVWIIYCKINKKDIIIALTENNIQENYNFFVYFFIFSILILMSLAINIILSWKFKEKKSTRFSKIFNAIAAWLAKYNIFYRTYGVIFNFIGHCRLKPLIDFAATILNYSEKKIKYIITIFAIVPRIIILFIFVFELFINKQLHYYFVSLILLLMPLLFRMFLFILKDLSDRVLPEFKALLDINSEIEPIEIPAGTPLTPGAPKKFKAVNIRWKPQYADGDLDHFLYSYYYPMLFLPGHMQVFVLPLYIKMNQIIIFIYCSVHALGWGYILFYLF